MVSRKPSEVPVAIIGMACIYPGAPDLAHYWDNIVRAVDAISEVPEARWPARYYDPASTEVDRFYCRRGGFVDDYVDFDPLQYGVMPKAAAAADPDQLLSLRVGSEALADAGYLTRDFPRDKAGVILGRGNYLSAGTLRLEQHVRQVEQTLQTLRDLLPDITTAQLHQVRDQIRSKLDYYGPDVALGMIPNLAASRLANRLDLRGPAYTVDAACASSLLAVEQACSSLRSGQTDFMLAGGLHFTHDLTFWATFCQLGALSRSQMVRPFSVDADGILAGEGIGMLVLRRLDDALAAGDRIYAVINGAASSSDGRSSSLLAPAVAGQRLALERAWQQTEFSPAQLGLVEAHGTGTPTGDLAELETLRDFFGTWQGDAPRPVLGSVKSMIGHTMPAAGVAGIIKAALAIHHAVLPPTLHCERPHPLLQQTRFRVLAAQEPWLSTGQPRIAAVNAFGFGGINAHVVLSEYRGETFLPAVATTGLPKFAVALGKRQQAMLPKVVVLSSETQEGLLSALRERHWQSSSSAGHWRLVIVEPDDKRLELAEKIVTKGQAWHGRNQIYFSADGLLSRGGKLAFMFPGVDSLFEPQVADVAEFFDLPLSEHCQRADPAVELFRVVLGLNKFNHLMFQALSALGIQADGMAGHSIGEFSAMAAGGMLTQERVAAVMGVLENDPATLSVPDVVFLAAACGAEQAAQVIADLDDICISHDNCPHQLILCGRIGAIETAARRLLEQNVLSQQLPFVSGFHSPMFADHLQQYRDFYAETELVEPQVPVWSATTAALFPRDMAAKKQLALDHLVQPVRFRELLEHMYADGYRAFIQVGTGSLVGFIDDTLKHQPHLAISANIAKRSGMAQLTHLVAALWVEGCEQGRQLLGLPGVAASAPAQRTAPAAPSAPAARFGTHSQRLRLGVPLVKLDQPLGYRFQQGVGFAPPAASALAGDPLQQVFQETLLSIQQASQDVHMAWQQRLQQRGLVRQQAPVAASPAIHAPAVCQSPPLVQPAPFRTRIRRRLDVLGEMHYLADHALYPQRPGWPNLADSFPVVPLTMEVELLREAIETQLPGYLVVRFEQVRAFSWLVVDEPRDITIHMELRDFPLVEVSIEGHIEARAIISTHYSASLEEAEPGERGERPFTALTHPRATQVTAAELYRDGWMFHGPAYQGVLELTRIADDGIDGRVRVASGKGALLDNMGQLAGYWVMEQDMDILAMPIRVEQIRFHAPIPALGKEFNCQVRVRWLDGASCVSDLRLLDEHGQVLVAISGWQTRRYPMDRAFFLASKQVEQRLVAEELQAGVVLFHDAYDTALVRDYLARRFISQPELVAYEALPPRRRRQWLNGRVAAKDAVRSYLWHKHGATPLYPKEFLISNAASGQPEVKAHVTQAFTGRLQVSIAHKDTLAIAMVAEHPVGVDIERIETRSDEFMALALTEAEQALLPQDARDEWLTRCWVAKEALAKCGGSGLEGQPRKFEVQEIDGQKLRVNEQWVITQKLDQYIIGWTL